MALPNKSALFLEVWNYFCQIRAERVCFWARWFVTRCALHWDGTLHCYQDITPLGQSTTYLQTQRKPPISRTLSLCEQRKILLTKKSSWKMISLHRSPRVKNNMQRDPETQLFHFSCRRPRGKAMNYEVHYKKKRKHKHASLFAGSLFHSRLWNSLK